MEQAKDGSVTATQIFYEVFKCAPHQNCSICDERFYPAEIVERKDKEILEIKKVTVGLLKLPIKKIKGVDYVDVEDIAKLVQTKEMKE